jgi:hypothetical protein
MKCALHRRNSSAPRGHMKIHRLIRFAVLAEIVVLFFFAIPARAYDHFHFEGSAGGASKIITLTGGDYELYVFARMEYGLSTPSCLFSGSLTGMSAPYDRISLGSAVILEPFDDDKSPKWQIDHDVTLSPGRYKLWISSESDCYWTFTLYAEPNQTAKSDGASTPAKLCCITGVGMLKISGGKYVPSGTASLSDSVRFTAFRYSSHPKNPAFGIYQIRHGETIVKAGLCPTGARITLTICTMSMCTGTEAVCNI